MAKRIQHTHMETLVDMAKSYRGATGKWFHIYEAFKQLEPYSALDQNAVKCRVTRAINKRKALNPLQPLALQSSPTETHRSVKRTACASCIARHKSCGSGRNPACEKVARTMMTIDRFFG